MPLLYCLLPLVAWLIFAKVWLKHHFTVKELAAQGALTLVVLVALFTISDRAQNGATKIINGAVTELRPVKRSCPIGWVTHLDSHCTEYTSMSVKIGESCSTDEKGNRSCTDVMQTQYNYHYPWERRYFVSSDVPEDFEIKRVDRQGRNTPPRFAQIRVGDPVAVEQFYRTYIKAASHSLFQAADVEPAEVAYPKVFDYYRANRVIDAGAGLNANTLATWNRNLDALNRDLRGKGANVILVLTKEPEIFSERLAKAWHAHNINDVVVVIGLAEDGQTIAWVDARSWSRQSLSDIAIEGGILDLRTLNPDAITAAVSEGVLASYQARDMSEFEYLKHEVSLPTITLILAFLVILVFTPLMTFIFARHVDWR